MSFGVKSSAKLGRGRAVVSKRLVMT